MISLTVGLGLILFGIYFGNIPVSAFGLLCFAAGAYAMRSKPLPKVAEKPAKTKHTVIISEPPNTNISPFELRGMPIDINKQDPDFLPLPDYGYTDPLEKIFINFPIAFWKKV